MKIIEFVLTRQSLRGISNSDTIGEVRLTMVCAGLALPRCARLASRRSDHYIKKYTVTTFICANIILKKPMCEVKK